MLTLKKLAFAAMYGWRFATYAERVHRLSKIVEEISRAYERPQPQERVR